MEFSIVHLKAFHNNGLLGVIDVRNGTSPMWNNYLMMEVPYAKSCTDPMR